MKEITNQDQTRDLVIIAGYYGFDNLGDEAILEELLREVAAICPQEKIIVLSNTPEKTAATFGVKSFNRWDWSSLIVALKRTRLFISGGGGLFQDRTGLGSVIFYGAQILLAHMYGAKILIYAQGVGPLHRLFSRQLTRFVFKQAQEITVRDNVSFDTVKSWGLQCQLTTDPVWSLPSSPLPPDIQKLTEAKESALKEQTSKNMTIGLSLREDPALKDYHLHALAQAITSTLPSRSIVLLLDFQGEKDHPPLKKIESLLSLNGFSTYWLTRESFKRPSQWLSLMDNIDFLIGMRFHALLMSLKVGKPVIGIAYDQKVSSLLEQFGQPSLSLEVAQSECQELWGESFKQFVTLQQELTGLAQERYRTIRQLSDKNIEALRKVLEAETIHNVK